MLDKQPLDVSRTLYDSDGYRHCLVQATPAQILTLVEGFYWLWDRATGRCLLEGMATTQLSNAKPGKQALQLQPSRVAETRALLLAQKAMTKAALSASASPTLRPAGEDSAEQGGKA